MQDPNVAQKFSAGDIAVEPMTGGYQLRRAIPGIDDFAWQYVATVMHRDVALALARRMADFRHVRAWLFDGEEYQEIPAREPGRD